MDEAQPRPEGMKAGPTVDERGVVRKYELRVGQAKRLAELLPEYAFFTPALLYLKGGFRDTPLADFSHQTGCVYYYKKFARPIFQGLESDTGDPDWNFVLWACSRSLWPALANFLVSLTLVDPERRNVVGVGEQAMAVADPLLADSNSLVTGVRSLIPVTGFGVNGNCGRWALQPPRQPLIEKPVLLTAGPDPEMILFARALRLGANPVNARSDMTSNIRSARASQTLLRP